MAVWDLQASAGAVGKSILWRGTWSGALSYNPYDGVYGSNGSSYISKTNNNNRDPTTNPPDWDLMASVGGQGPQGTTGAAGSQGPPGSAGSQGPQGNPGAPGAVGANAWTTSSVGFTVPAVGATVNVTVNDAQWVAVGEVIYVAGANGSGQAGALEVTAKVGNTLTLLNPVISTGGGTGDVVGPPSSIANELAIYSDATGKLLGRLTKAQLKTDLALTKGDVGLGSVDNLQQQPIDADLTAIAAIAPANDDVIQRKAGAWTNRTMAQVKTDLALGKADVGLGSVDNTADSAKPVSTTQQAAIRPTFTTLTDGGTITWTLTASNATHNATVTLGGARTLAFSGVASGMNGTLIVKQDGTGGRTLALPGGSKVINGGGGAAALSTAINAADILTWIYDGTNYWWTLGKNYT